MFLKANINRNLRTMIFLKKYKKINKGQYFLKFNWVVENRQTKSKNKTNCYNLNMRRMDKISENKIYY